MIGLAPPTRVTVDLAYLVGVLAGDGSINMRAQHDYEVKCVGDVKEWEFYDLVICPLFKKLFELEVKAGLHDVGTTYGVRIWSKELVCFLSEKFGLPIGKKYNGLKIPRQIKSSDVLMKAFIQGLADTDFSLALKRRYRKRRYYPTIVGVSKSRKFMVEVSAYLEGLGFSVSKDFDKVQEDKRFGKVVAHVIQLYGHNQLAKWVTTIGFRNPKHLKKVEFWRKANKNNNWAKPALELVAGGGMPKGGLTHPSLEPPTSRTRACAQMSPGFAGAPNSRLDAL